MVKEGGYTIENLYQGGYSSLSSSYGDMFTGYHVSAGDTGITTDPRTANILKDASSKLSGGSKQVELTLVSPEIFDSVPKQHLQEINRLGKLTGTEMSVHGPVIDSAGFTQQGFSEVNRENAERRISDVVKRSYDVDPRGNVPVVFHSAEGIPGTEWKTFGENREARRLVAVNRESGKMIPLEEEKRHYPDMERVRPEYEEKIKKGLIPRSELRNHPERYIEQIPLEKGEIISPERNLKIANDTEWSNAVDQSFFNKERADEILQKNHVQISHFLKDFEEGRIREEDINRIPEYKQAYLHYKTAENYLDDVNKNINSLFSRAYKYGTPDQRKELQKIADNFKEEIQKSERSPFAQSQAMQQLLSNLQRPGLAPEMYVPIEEFAVEKSSQTFGNAAFEAYKKYGKKAPVMMIENPPAGFALSTGEDLKNLIQNSRDQFVQKAVETGKLSQSEAREAAEKLIGATWDVGHINMLRKQGASEQDIIKETEKIAPFVKHIHLSDNFGFEHTELPMGMGNVPLKEMLEKLPEKDVKKIVEAGQWWQHFQTNPIKESLEGLGSPIYEGGPLWNQSPALQQGYFSGYGMMLPSMNYNFWGSGFSMASLPTELGGNLPGRGGGMSGTPME